MEQVRTHYLKNINTHASIEKLDTYISKITDIRRKIYDTTSVDLFDESGSVIGYKISSASIPTLKKIFLLNSLQRKLVSLKKELQKK